MRRLAYPAFVAVVAVLAVGLAEQCQDVGTLRASSQVASLFLALSAILGWLQLGDPRPGSTDPQKGATR